MISGIIAIIASGIALFSRKQEIKATERAEHREISTSDKKASSWRNAIGWVCTLILAYHLIIRDLLLWTTYQLGYELKADLPIIDHGLIIKLIFAMLGADSGA